MANVVRHIDLPNIQNWRFSIMPAMNPVDLDRLFGEALNAGNIEALLALYEANASFTPEPGAELHGTDAIRGALEGFIAMKPKVTLDSKTIAQIDDVALCTSNWTLSGTGPERPRGVGRAQCRGREETA
jgi:uncharacterized protein (TIGR02246 family)